MRRINGDDLPPCEKFSHGNEHIQQQKDDKVVVAVKRDDTLAPSSYEERVKELIVFAHIVGVAPECDTATRQLARG